jgi:uncharacterized membrane protein HdeD (DUF308 family)
VTGMQAVNAVILGAIAMASLVAGGFFLRFWRDGHDRFFLLFALSFFVEGLNRFAIALSPTPNEASPWLYGVRLLAFALIIAAAVDKNRSAQPG